MGKPPQGRLEDIAEIVMGQSPEGEACNTAGKGMPLLNGPTEFGGHHPTPVQYTSDARKLAAKGDILFCVRGSTTGKMNWADRPYAIGRGLAAIRPKHGNDTAHYVRAVIEAGLSQLLQAATGSTFPNVSREQLLGMPCRVLGVSEQKRIAGILGALDDKIELNRKMNETLEQMARALFKSWFVDFDPVHAKAAGRQPTGMDKATADLFPDSFADSELGKIPEGWSAGTIKTSFSLTMGQSPPGETYSQVASGLPFYQGSTDFGFRFPQRRIFCTAPTRLANEGDTLVSVRAPVGDINMASEACCIGRGVAAVRHNSGAKCFTYHAVENLRPHFEKFDAEGTVFGSINKDGFEKIPFVTPTEKIVASFEKLSGPLDEEIRNLEVQSRKLTEMRDLLLPKLLRGELSMNAP